MMSRSEEIKRYLVPGKRVHLIGIGGVSMRPLGLVLKDMGMVVSGSDMNSSVSTEELIAKGIHVAIGHEEGNVDGVDGTLGHDAEMVQLLLGVDQESTLGILLDPGMGQDGRFNKIRG